MNKLRRVRRSAVYQFLVDPQGEQWKLPEILTFIKVMTVLMFVLVLIRSLALSGLS